MNFKEWIFPLTLAMTITFFIQYFMGPQVPIQRDKVGVSGQTFTAPEVEQAQKPLNVMIDFDKESGKTSQEHVVKTEKATYTFSSKGAVLESLDFAWQNGSQQVSMLPQNAECFMVALDKETPLHYDFVREYTVNDGAVIAVEYKAGNITKTFMIHRGTYQIDVQVAVDAKQAESVRMFYPMPAPLDSSEDVKGIVNKMGSVGQAITLQDIALEKSDTLKQFWFEPKTFGFSSKFLIQTFVSGDAMLMRSYFKLRGNKQYQAILETKPLEAGQTFTGSFYFGPKSMQAMSVVAPFLEQTLDYGWFAFLAKPMLKLLNTLKEQFGDYGIAIILLTLLLKLIMLPFTLKGEKSMKQQGEFQKKLAYIRQKYKHDKAALDRANAELIQKHGVPGVAGCLPMLLNIPFFIALNRVLSSSIELYGSSFLWLPDLAAKDPYYLLGIGTAICMLMTPAMGGDSKQAAMKYGSALFLGTVVTYLSSGLALFIFVNTLFGVIQSFGTKILTGAMSRNR